MSSDLLKRAATKLREHAKRLPEPWATRPWRTVATDTERIDGLAACVNDHADDPHGAFDCCWSSEPVGHEAVASFIVLMDPPAVLALADLLGVLSWMPSLANDTDLQAAEVLARTILGEEATS